MISVPLPADTLGLASARCAATLPPGADQANTASPIAATSAGCRRKSLVLIGCASWEDEIDLAPVLLRGGAFGGPIGCVIELIGHLRRPVAADVAVEQIALDRLAEAGGAARAIGLPAWREHQ